jgi:hypothetical protein
MHCGAFLEAIGVSRMLFTTELQFYEMMGLWAVIPLGHEYNRWNLPLDQLPMKFMNYREWRNPLIWDVNFQCYKLF